MKVVKECTITYKQFALIQKILVEKFQEALDAKDDVESDTIFELMMLITKGNAAAAYCILLNGDNRTKLQILVASYGVDSFNPEILNQCQEIVKLLR